MGSTWEVDVACKIGQLWLCTVHVINVNKLLINGIGPMLTTVLWPQPLCP